MTKNSSLLLARKFRFEEILLTRYKIMQNRNNEENLVRTFSISYIFQNIQSLTVKLKNIKFGSFLSFF